MVAPPPSHHGKREKMVLVSELRAKLGVAGTLLLVLVVAAAAGAAGGPAAAGSGSVGGLGVPDWAGSLVVGFVAAGGTVLVYGLVAGLLSTMRGRRRFFTKKLPWWYWPITVAVVAAATALLLGLLALLAHGKVHGRASSPVGLRLPVSSAPHFASRANPSFSWEPLVAGAALALAAVVAYALMTRRRARPTSLPKPLVEREALLQRRREAVAAIDESLDALWAEPDPRKAVIAAYARMDSWLARAGFGRRASEAPFEHLDRVMGGLGATAAVGAALAELFERAKFDRRPCGAEMKQSALSALVKLRGELAAAALLPALPGP